MITATDLITFFHNAFFIAFGTSIQLACILAEISAKKNRHVGLFEFIRKRVWKTYLMVCGGVLGYYMLTATVSEPSVIALIAVGWACNDAIDKLGTVTSHTKINKGDNIR
jgi:hypothetical protein